MTDEKEQIIQIIKNWLEGAPSQPMMDTCASIGTNIDGSPKLNFHYRQIEVWNKGAMLSELKTIEEQIRSL